MPEELDENAKEERKTGKDKSPEKRIEELLIEVTPENIHQFSINDVVMPICGYKTKMPNNEELKAIIFGIMKEDNISMETFESHVQLDSTSAWGSYRKIIGFASDIEYSVVEF